jgi:type I restriction enzyme S subunit
VKITKTPKSKISGIEWFGEMPNHWQRTRLRFLANGTVNSFIDGDWIEAPYITEEGIRLLQCGNVGTGVFEEQGFRHISPKTFDEFKCTEVSPSDILICRLQSSRTILAGRACLAPDLGVRMITSVDNCILKPSPAHDARFIVYQLSMPAYLSFIETVARGGTRDRISRSMLGSIEVVAPSHSEQCAIANFLDRKTAQIDTLIAKKQRLIELLQEKRQALISHAVTKGLDPNVPMKDSGVEWLGTIPAHWAVERLKFRMSRIEQGWSPQCDNRQADPGEWGVLKVGCMNSGVYDESENKALPANLEPIRDYEVCVGDVLMSRSNTVELVGAVGRVHETQGRILLCDKLYRLGLDSTRLHPDFAVHLLRSRAARLQLERDASGASSSMKNVSNERVTNMVLSFPPLDEQKYIVHFLKHSLEQSRQIERKVVQQITKLQEYRQTLISAAVTGKIDVTKEAHP